MRRLLIAAIVAPIVAAGCGTVGATPTAVRVALARDLPPLRGDRLRATVVEVTYGPGGSSSPHSHPCPVIGYVVEGALRTQVQGEPEAVYSAGQTFYEPPGSVHAVAANASREKPVRFLAYFTCDHDGALSTDVSR